MHKIKMQLANTKIHKYYYKMNKKIEQISQIEVMNKINK